MYYDVVDFKYLGERKIELIFENGKRGVVDLESYSRKGGVFARFSDIEYFKQVILNKDFGVLCWPGGVDIAPETLYSSATGEPLPEWMTRTRDQSEKEVA
jgi:Protein of unknown function (DUF2442)